MNPRKVLTPEQMGEVDRATIAGGIPGIILMETAAARCVEYLVAKFAPLEEQRILVVCGKGNNGGDGYVIARHLAARGADVAVFSTLDPARLKGDALVNHDGYVGVGGTVRSLAGPGGAGAPQLDDELARADTVVDALFGTGLDRPLTPEAVHTKWSEITGFEKSTHPTDVTQSMSPILSARKFSLRLSV